MLEDKVVSYLDLIAKAAEKAGPQVMKFAVAQERWNGIGDVTVGFFLFVVFLVALWVFNRNLKAACDNEDPATGLCIVSGICGLLALVIGCTELLNIWNWVAIFNPRIALFHDILDRFLQH